MRGAALGTILGLIATSAGADDVLSSEHRTVCEREWIAFNRVEPGDRSIPVTARKTHIFRLAFDLAGVNLGSIMFEPWKGAAAGSDLYFVTEETFLAIRTEAAKMPDRSRTGNAPRSVGQGTDPEQGRVHGGFPSGPACRP